MGLIDKIVCHYYGLSIVLSRFIFIYYLYFIILKYQSYWINCISKKLNLMWIIMLSHVNDKIKLKLSSFFQRRNQKAETWNVSTTEEPQSFPSSHCKHPKPFYLIELLRYVSVTLFLFICFRISPITVQVFSVRTIRCLTKHCGYLHVY